MTQRVTFAGKEYEILGPVIEQCSPSSRRVFIEAVEVEPPKEKESIRLRRKLNDALKADCQRGHITYPQYLVIESALYLLGDVIKAEIREELPQMIKEMK